MCGNTSEHSFGKHPIGALVPRGFRDASDDLNTLRQWWSGHPRANIGLATSSRLAVVDIDKKNGGLDTFDQLVKQHGAAAFATSARVETGGGGLHLWFKAPPGTSSQDGFLKGIDLKAENGMILVPFSRHRSCAPYVFNPPLSASFNIDSLPDIPAPFLSALKRTSQAPTVPKNGKVANGQRNNTLASMAGVLRRAGAEGGVIEQFLMAQNTQVFETPLPAAELRTTIASIAKKAPAASSSITFIGADELVARVPPQVSWLVPGLIAEGCVTEIAGQPKSGKSTLVRGIVASVLSGTPFMNLNVTRAPVLMLSEERDGSLSHALAEHKIASRSLRLLQRERAAGAPWVEIVEASIEDAKRTGARLLIVDTLPSWSLTDGDENSAADALKAMAPLLTAAASGLGVVAVRHMRKSGGDLVSAGRGSSAFTGATDIVCTLAPHVAGDTLRSLDATGRFKDAQFSIVIELTPAGYVNHGSGKHLAQQAQLALEQAIVAVLPRTESTALAEKNILPLLAVSRAIGRTKLTELLKQLLKKGTVRSTGNGTRTDPTRYWVP